MNNPVTSSDTFILRWKNLKVPALHAAASSPPTPGPRTLPSTGSPRMPQAASLFNVETAKAQDAPLVQLGSKTLPYSASFPLSAGFKGHKFNQL